MRKILAVIAIGLFPLASNAAPAAATSCPHQAFANNINLAKNASFESGLPTFQWKIWNNGNQIPASSAATAWNQHSDNFGSTVKSRLVPTNVPGPGGFRMLHFIAGGGEGGIYQPLQNPPATGKLMFSAWVYVRSGQLVLQPHGGNQGPNAWSTKIGQWEQLRVCTDGSVPIDALVIYNQVPSGGEFFVDRVEAREMP
jgi:hypothetical protein